MSKVRYGIFGVLLILIAQFLTGTALAHSPRIEPIFLLSSVYSHILNLTIFSIPFIPILYLHIYLHDCSKALQPPSYQKYVFIPVLRAVSLPFILCSTLYLSILIAEGKHPIDATIDDVNLGIFLPLIFGAFTALFLIRIKKENEFSKETILSGIFNTYVKEPALMIFASCSPPSYFFGMAYMMSKTVNIPVLYGFSLPLLAFGQICHSKLKKYETEQRKIAYGFMLKVLGLSAVIFSFSFIWNPNLWKLLYSMQ